MTTKTEKQIKEMDRGVKIMFPDTSTPGYNDHWSRTEQKFFMAGFKKAIENNEKEINRYDEAIEHLEFLWNNCVFVREDLTSDYIEKINSFLKMERKKFKRDHL